MKVFSMSQRIYYKDLEPEAELFIKKDLELYNCMLHKAFKICFDRAYKDATYSETDQRMIKSFYGTVQVIIFLCLPLMRPRPW